MVRSRKEYVKLCLVPRPQYFAVVNRFGSRGLGRKVWPSMISLAWKISYCLSANHNPELRCIVCTGVTLFALVLHLNCTALSQSESSGADSCLLHSGQTIVK